VQFWVKWVPLSLKPCFILLYRISAHSIDVCSLKMQYRSAFSLPLWCKWDMSSFGILGSVNGCFWPTFRDYTLVPFSRIQRSKENCWSPDDGTDRLSETSVTNYHFTFHRITKQHRRTKLFLRYLIKYSYITQTKWLLFKTFSRSYGSSLMLTKPRLFSLPFSQTSPFLTITRDHFQMSLHFISHIYVNIFQVDEFLICPILLACFLRLIHPYFFSLIYAELRDESVWFHKDLTHKKIILAVVDFL